MLPELASMNNSTCETQIEINGFQFSVSRPPGLGLVIEGPCSEESPDYLHDILLSQNCRDELFSLVELEGLVVCKNVRSSAPSYRKVRGKSSHGKLSQAEYYHHDGCSCPTKPRVVEIRMPHQAIPRQVATAIAPFPSVITAMLKCLPAQLAAGPEFMAWRLEFEPPVTDWPAVETWDKFQGRMTRMVRKELDAESCRSYFRDVDREAGAYDLPWEMGESRLMLNAHDDLAKTMQHRRAYQQARATDDPNGSLVKRWTAEEA
ncbi:MAG: hypothetical protein ACI87E_004704 [Mariniblastus sp.]|jgi:hypothetical protein